MHESEKWKGSRSVVSNSSRPHGPQPTWLLCPWDFPGKSAGVGCHFFPYGERDYLRPSFDMDCLLALRPLLLLVSLVACKVWSFDLYLKKLPCNMVYISTQNSVKHPCSTRDLGPCVLLSLSLCFWLIPWSAEAYQAHFPALASKTSQDFLRGRPAPTWAVQALSEGFIGFQNHPGNISFFLSFTFLSLTPYHQAAVH